MTKISTTEPTGDAAANRAAPNAAVWRLFAPQRRDDGARRKRFIIFLALCLAVHIALVAYLLTSRTFDLPLPPPEEVPIEVITEPPPEAPKEEPPKEEEKQEAEKEKPKPPPKPPAPQPEMEVKEATDAPRDANKEAVERDAPDKETKAPSVAPPKPDMAQKPEEKAAPKDARDEATRPDPDAGAPKSLEDKLEAEIIERAEPTPAPSDKTGRKQAKPEQKIGEARSIADQIASLAPLPDYELGSSAKPSPVGGGNAKTTYLSILYGMIMPKMQVAARIKTMNGRQGVVTFYLDEEGHLTHQAVRQSSGIPELDAAAISAIKRSAPFPRPPPGHPRALMFSYSPR